MRKPEQKLWDVLRRNCPQNILLERIENLVETGTPDFHLVSRRGVAWVELKAIESPPKRATTPLLGDKGCNPSQINWHLNYARFGGISYILIGVGKMHHRTFFAVDGCHAPIINKLPMIALPGLISAQACTNDAKEILTWMAS